VRGRGITRSIRVLDEVNGGLGKKVLGDL
jgi:3-deoxy-D-manno-octulosonic acid (KDO) 8-phosphate synthase